MKKLVAVLGLVTVVSVVNCGAWEYPQNPDRFPSIGLNLTGESMAGEVKSPSFPALGSQDIEGTDSTLVLDTRLPLSNSFTLNIALGGTRNETKYKQTPTQDSAEIKGDGGIFSIGCRYYFNK